MQASNKVIRTTVAIGLVGAGVVASVEAQAACNTDVDAVSTNSGDYAENYGTCSYGSYSSYGWIYAYYDNGSHESSLGSFTVAGYGTGGGNHGFWYGGKLYCVSSGWHDTGWNGPYYADIYPSWLTIG